MRWWNLEAEPWLYASEQVDASARYVRTDASKCGTPCPGVPKWGDECSEGGAEEEEVREGRMVTDCIEIRNTLTYTPPGGLSLDADQELLGSPSTAEAWAAFLDTAPNLDVANRRFEEGKKKMGFGLHWDPKAGANNPNEEVRNKETWTKRNWPSARMWAHLVLDKDTRERYEELLPVLGAMWRAFARAHPTLAARMHVEAHAHSEEVSPIPGTGWLGGFVGEGSSRWHNDEESVGEGWDVLFVFHVGEVSSGNLVVRVVLKNGTARRIIVRTVPGSMTVFKAGRDWHASTDVEGKGKRLVVSLYNDVRVLGSIKRKEKNRVPPATAKATKKRKKAVDGKLAVWPPVSWK